MSGTRAWTLIIVVLCAIAAWRFWPQEEPQVEVLPTDGPPVILRGVREAAGVQEPERVEDQWTRKNSEAIGRLETSLIFEHAHEPVPPPMPALGLD